MHSCSQVQLQRMLDEDPRLAEICSSSEIPEYGRALHGQVQSGRMSIQVPTIYLNPNWGNGWREVGSCMLGVDLSDFSNHAWHASWLLVFLKGVVSRRHPHHHCHGQQHQYYLHHRFLTASYITREYREWWHSWHMMTKTIAMNSDNDNWYCDWEWIKCAYLTIDNW